MRTILTLLLFTPFIALSNIECVFSVHRYQTNWEIPNVVLKLNKNSAATNVAGKATMQFWSLQDLQDTLFLEHSEYTFEIMPLPLHKLSVRGNKIFIDIIAYPKVNRVYRFTSDKNRKKYGKDLQLSLRAYRFNEDLDEWKLINGDTIHDLGAPSFDQNYILEKLITPKRYDQGFKSTIRGREYKYQIDWFQENYLFYPKRKSELNDKIDLLEAYFVQQAANKDEIGKIHDRHRRVIWKQQDLIDSLMTIILKEPYVSEIEPEEPEPEPYFSIGDFHRAEHPYDKELMHRSIQETIDKSKHTKKAKLVIWFRVDEKGKIRPQDKKLFPETEDLANEIIKVVCNEYWKPAKLNGRTIEDLFVVSIELE